MSLFRWWHRWRAQEARAEYHKLIDELRFCADLEEREKAYGRMVYARRVQELKRMKSLAWARLMYHEGKTG